MKFNKEKANKILTRKGFAAADIKNMVTDHIEYVERVYSDSTNSEKLEVIIWLWANKS